MLLLMDKVIRDVSSNALKNPDQSFSLLIGLLCFAIPNMTYRPVALAISTELLVHVEWSTSCKHLAV